MCVCGAACFGRTPLPNICSSIHSGLLNRSVLFVIVFPSSHHVWPGSCCSPHSGCVRAVSFSYSISLHRNVRGQRECTEISARRCHIEALSPLEQPALSPMAVLAFGLNTRTSGVSWCGVAPLQGEVTSQHKLSQVQLLDQVKWRPEPPHSSLSLWVTGL